VNKNVVLSGTVIIIVILLIFTFMVDEEVTYENFQNLQQVKNINETRGDEQVIVDYTTTEPVNHPIKTTISTVSKKKIVKPEFYSIKAKTSDDTYEISLTDTSEKFMPNKFPKSKKLVPLQGTIDNKAFTIYIPEYFLDKSESTELKITNKRSKISKTSQAYFFNSLKELDGKRLEIDFQSDDLENYNERYVQQVAPPL
jgi:hypothetical protein